MKKFLALGAFALLALSFSVPASAGPHWVTKEIGFKISNAGPNGVFARDTAYAHVGPVGLADTTEWVVLDRLFEPKGGYAAIADSITVGYFVFVSDTSAIYTASLTALTTIIDVGAPSLNNAGSNTYASIRDQVVGAAVVSSGSQLVSTGDKIVAVPIMIGQLTVNSLRTKAGLVQALPIRCRVTAGVGGQGLAQARAFVVYQRDDISGY
jgi:hypothetical protein